VAVLGPVEVRGAARPLRRSRTVELVAYLALHPHGATTDVWATALWPERVMAPPTLHSTCSAARRALGRSRSGRDHLPRARGRLQLGRSVGTDWARFRRLAAGPSAHDWWRALELVRGRPFEDLVRSDWPLLEGFVAEMEEAVVAVALRLANHHLVAGDGGGAAARAARRGLRASPYDERLYRVLLEAADRDGHPAGVEAVMGELRRLLDPVPGRHGAGLPTHHAPCDLVHPQTAALYRSLTRHGDTAAVTAIGGPTPRL
jgi:DNA-binding SARP family transcriptional activator